MITDRLRIVSDTKPSHCDRAIGFDLFGCDILATHHTAPAMAPRRCPAFKKPRISSLSLAFGPNTVSISSKSMAGRMLPLRSRALLRAGANSWHLGASPALHLIAQIDLPDAVPVRRSELADMFYDPVGLLAKSSPKLRTCSLTERMARLRFRPISAPSRRQCKVIGIVFLPAGLACHQDSGESGRALMPLGEERTWQRSGQEPLPALRPLLWRSALGCWRFPQSSTPPSAVS